MSLRPAFYKMTWLWEGQRGFAEERGNLSQTGATLEIAVAPESYPQVKFTKDEALELEKLISEDMIKVESSEIPKFTKAYENDGVLVGVCANLYTFNWFHSYVRRIQYKESNLKVGVRKNIPFWKMSFVSPEALAKDAAEDVVNALVLQNQQLRGLWAVEGTEREATGQRVKCLVGEEVLSTINRIGNRAYLGMHEITLNIDTEQQ